MYKFYPKIYGGRNQYDNEIKYCFVSKRLAKLIQKKETTWLYRYFDLKHFTMFDEKYIAVLISSDGLILFVKYENIDRYIETDKLTELMTLFIEKNTKLSFMDLIKFSDKYGLNIDVKFK